MCDFKENSDGGPTQKIMYSHLTMQKRALKGAKNGCCKNPQIRKT